MIALFPECGSQKCEVISNVATAIIWLASLVSIVALNVLALTGNISFSTVACVNGAIGGTFALYHFVSAIIAIKKGNAGEAFLNAIGTVASLALAASGLFFAKALPMKAAAGLALGGILLPSLSYFVATSIMACKEKCSNGPKQEEKVEKKNPPHLSMEQVLSTLLFQGLSRILPRLLGF